MLCLEKKYSCLINTSHSLCYLCYKSVASFFSDLKVTGKTFGYNKIAIFAHGGVLISAQVYAGTISPENAMQKLPAYGEIVRITL